MADERIAGEQEEDRQLLNFLTELLAPEGKLPIHYICIVGIVGIDGEISLANSHARQLISPNTPSYIRNGLLFDALHGNWDSNSDDDDE